MTKHQKVFLIGVLGLIIIAQGFFQLEVSSIPTQGQKADSGAVLGATLPVAGTTYSISGSGIAPSDTSITLQSFTIPQTGQKIQSTDLSPIFYLTLEPGNNTKQEIVGCTTLVQNVTGTATVSNCLRGLSPITPYSASTTLQFAHAGGSRVILSDAPQLFNLYAAKANNELISGAWQASSSNPWSYDGQPAITSSSTSLTIPTASWVFNDFVDLYDNQSVGGIKTFTSKDVFSVVPTISQAPAVGTDAANKTYVDGVALVSAPNADTATKGVVQEATPSQINNFVKLGSTGADLYLNPIQFSLSMFASSTASTTQYLSNTSISTTTTLQSGQTLVVMVSTDTQSSNSAGLYIKPAHNATTTLEGQRQNSSSGNMVMSFNGSYTATTTDSVQVYLGDTSANTVFRNAIDAGTSFTLMKLASSTAN